MRYARHIGRAGGLAVALGVGLAVATTPGVAHADPSVSVSSSSDDSSSTTKTSSAPTSSTDASADSSANASSGGAATSPGELDAVDSSSAPGPADESDDDQQAVGGADQSSTGGGVDTAPASDDEDTSYAAQPADAVTDDDSSDQRVPSRSARGRTARASTKPDTLGDVASFAATAGDSIKNAAQQSPMPRITDVNAVPAPRSLPAPAPATALTTARAVMTGSALPAPAVPELPHPVVRAVSQMVTALAGLVPGPGSPTQSSLMWAVAAWMREIEQGLGIDASNAGPQHTTGQPAALAAVQSPNLLVNPGAEFGDPSLSGYSSVTLPGWTVAGTPTAIQYGTRRRLPSPLPAPGLILPRYFGFPSYDTRPPDAGLRFFGGGNVATATLSQSVDLSAVPDIDSGAVSYTLSGLLGGAYWDSSAASVTVEFLAADQSSLGTATIGPVTPSDRRFRNELQARSFSGNMPAGTRSARVVVNLTAGDKILGTYNNAYADNISFTVGASLPAPPPPTPPDSNVGQLDHVFMVYMENKGFTDIVGSPNAPYLNTLINTYGFGTNYYALTHPSDPNYYPIAGGSDFGANWNCPLNCFSERNLADNIEAANKTWRGYAQGMPIPGFIVPVPGIYAPDALPFLAFNNIFANPARRQAHLFPLYQMTTDLQSAATTPNFVWFAANDETNMEGPSEGIGAVRWFISQLTTHQYNVAAGDQFLQDTIPIIMNSEAWQTERCAIIITFDEDYDNLSLGIGNQGNHITTIVIPSPNSGMRQGHFVVDDYNNHYSLLRTIELSLGLPPLTNNDRYAEPMNGYWP